jgi:hypothetical protein
MNFLRAYLLALRGTIPETGKSVNTKVEDDARKLARSKSESRSRRVRGCDEHHGRTAPSI